MGYEVFISHSSRDKPMADAACAALETAGIRCWIAPRDILPGTDWSEAIVTAIAECPVAVLIFSENANASPQVRREVQRAFEKGRRVVPFRIEAVMPGEALEYYLGPVHWLDALTPPLESHLGTLVETIHRLLPPREEPPVPARSGGLEGREGESTDQATAAGNAGTPAPTGHLPVPATPYIGRESELVAWQELLLQPTTRVLTLIGFGGMGKTRSALELATRCVAAFPDGVWWVELEEAHNGEQMLPRIAGQLPVSVKPQLPLLEQIVHYLLDKHLLLVLDNTEQIPDAGAVVQALLKGIPTVKWLVTSRCALELPAERTVEVPPLPQEDAEVLFIERAQARNADFARTEENAADIAELCRRLEGMPLAIELAASRVAGMTPREILDRLEDRFRLLQTRAPHLPPRQRAMTGAIEWSHDLLADEDRALFAQLSVFAGGFKLADAEAICDVLDVFEGVQELRRHSLLRAETHAATQQMRFLMLELVRAYAEQKLDDEEVRKRHAEHFLRFAEQQAAQMRTRNEAQALEALRLELENVVAALRWARSHDQPEISARLALALSRTLHCLGFWSLEQQRLQEGLAAAEACSGETRQLRAAFKHDLAGLALDRDDLAEARAQGEASLALYQELNEATGIADALNLLGLLAMQEGDREAAQRLFTDALQRRPEGDHNGHGMGLHNLALLASQCGEREGARRLYEESLTHRRAAGDARGEAETLGNLGALAYYRQDYAEARRLYRESLALSRTLRDPHGIALMLYNLGELDELDGEASRAIICYVHAERLFRNLHSGHAAVPAEALQRLAQKLGADTFATTCQAAEKTAWETVV